jgi:hypothetical protein
MDMTEDQKNFAFETAMRVVERMCGDLGLATAAEMKKTAEDIVDAAAAASKKLDAADGN